MTPSSPDRKPADSPRYGDETLAIIGKGFPVDLSEAAARPQRTLQEMDIKRKELARFYNLAIKKSRELKKDHNAQALLRDLVPMKKEARSLFVELGGLIGEERKRLVEKNRICEDFARELDKADAEPKGEKKKMMYLRLSRDLSNPNLLGEVTKDEVADLLLRAQEGFNTIEREDLSQELKQIREADEEEQPFRELRERVELLLSRARIPGLEDLLVEIQEVKSGIDQELKAIGDEKSAIARIVRRAGMKVRFHLERASFTQDKNIWKTHMVEAMNALHEAVILDGNPEGDRIEALKEQFRKAHDPDDGTYRCILLDLVASRPELQVTVNNIEGILDSRKSPRRAIQDKRTADKKDQDFTKERRRIANKDDPGKRAEGFKMLLRKIKVENERDKKFAIKYGNSLFQRVSGDLERSFQMALIMSKRLVESEGVDASASKAMLSLLEEWYSAEESPELDSKVSKAWEGLSGKYNNVSQDTLEGEDDSGDEVNAPKRIQSTFFRNAFLAALLVAAGGVAYQNRREILGTPLTSVELRAGLEERLNPHGYTLERCQSAIKSWNAQPDSPRSTEEIELWSMHERRLIVMEKIQVVVGRLEAGERVTTSEIRAIIGTGPEDSVLTDLTRDLELLSR